MSRWAVCAGEASGDLIGARGLKTFFSRNGPAPVGIGGPRLREIGVETWFDCSELSVRGYVETLRQLPRILGIRRSFLNRLVHSPPVAYFGIDAPDFNLGVEETLRARGVSTVQFVSPAIWAWRANRIEKIKRAVEHMLCIFPFETALYKDTGVKALFVGHPLASEIPFAPDKQPARDRLGLTDGRPVLAILPGSRASEIAALGKDFLEVAISLAGEFQSIIPAATPDIEQRIQSLPNWLIAQAKGVRLVSQPLGAPPVSHLVMQAADIGLVASGTAALEMALFGRPHLIAYRVPWLTYRLMKAQSQARFIGLPNIILDAQVVPEYIQENCNAAELIKGIQGLQAHTGLYESTVERFSLLHSALQQDTPSLISDYLEDAFKSCASA